VNEIYSIIKSTKQRVIQELIDGIDKDELEMFSKIIEKMENNIHLRSRYGKK
jgi:hypothetical protein